jgi:hypothetical protein
MQEQDTGRGKAVNEANILLLRSIVTMQYISRENVGKLTKTLYKRLPKFPDGRINYRHSRIAPVVNVFVTYKDKTLLLKRSNKVRTYKGMWAPVGGYIDELRPVREIALKEIREELGIREEDISTMRIGRAYRFDDRKIGMTWVICPYFVKLNKRKRIRIDWEHSEYRWVTRSELPKYNILPSLAENPDRIKRLLT